MSCCQAAEAPEDDRLRASARDLGDGGAQLDFIVPDMNCAGCISTIERGLIALPQVGHVRANLSTRTVSVVWQHEVGPAAEIGEALVRLGYSHMLRENADEAEQALAARGRRLLLSLAVAGFAAANIMLLSVSVWSGADPATTQLFHLISGLIAVPAIAFAGRPFFVPALAALSHGRLNMDVPISLAVLLALGMSLYESMTGGAEAYFDAAVTLLFFLLVGRYLEHLMRQRARGAVRRLAGMAAKGAMRIRNDGTVSYISLSDIRPDMRLRVPAGERLAVDGAVIDGRADVDRSMVTGESMPVAVEPGDRLEAGVMILNGAVDVRAVSSAETSFLAEIARMMTAAERGRGPHVRIAEKVARLYAPVVHLLALAAFVGWVASGAGWHEALMTAIAVLIVTCPCALGLAVPVVHVVAAGRLFGAGVMLRDGAALERLAEIDIVVFDKTGTLSEGRPTVTSMTGDGQRRLIRTLAARSAHPAAKAVAEYLGHGPELRVSQVTEHPGLGVEAHLDGKRCRLGRASWVGEIATRIPESEASTVSFAIDGATPTAFLLTDPLRPEAASAVESLRSAGLSVEIASGDAHRPVADAAGVLRVGVASASLRPEEKIARIEALRADGRNVLMVGDGLNDAPALAAGHVSMAPGTASEIGRLAADLVFIRGDLRAVPLAHEIAVRAGRLVRQNFGLAFAYNCIAVPLAMAGGVTPLVAAIAMSLSSIVVVLNSLRLGVLSAPQTEPPITAAPLPAVA